MNKKNNYNLLSIFVILFVALMSVGLVSAGHYDYVTGSDSTDVFSINTGGVNTTNVNANQQWTSWNFFTPRLNFTKNVSDSFIGGNTSVYNYIMWKNLYNFTPTLKVYNGSARQLVGSGNYSLRNITSTQWVLDWLFNNYTNQNISINFNKNFTKNVDDITQSPSNIYIGATKESFLVENSPDWGVNKSFQFTGISAGNLGEYINNTNWAIGWTYTNRTYDPLNGTANCTDNEHNLWMLILLIVLIGFLIYAVAMIPNGGFLDIAKVILLAVALMIAVNLLSILRSSC
jgi:hypothetical protein